MNPLSMFKNISHEIHNFHYQHNHVAHGALFCSFNVNPHVMGELL